MGRLRAHTCAGRAPLLCALLLGAALLTPADAWQLWTDASASPFARDGHSLLLWNDSLYLFGGRSVESFTQHNPHTYEIKRVNGSWQFETYDGRPVKECVGATFEECYNIMVGKTFNDVWRYSLRCTRGWDTGCIDSVWQELASGATLGGCVIRLGKEVCSHPQERFGHAATIFPDGRLVVYGGFSRLCEDFCSDMWSLNLLQCRGGSTCKWQPLETLGRHAPGKRWNMAYTSEGNRWVMFGGHRLWHGFGAGNTLDNRWLVDFSKFEFGGFMDDLWVVDYNGSDASLISPHTPGGAGGWRHVTPRESCYRAPPTLVHADRTDIVCTVLWPRARASAALTISGEALYVHGGYSVPFPYPHVLGPGAGQGLISMAADSVAPYSTHPYFLSDLWLYNFTTGLWREITPRSLAKPDARRAHSLNIASGILILFGGFGNNHVYGDTWLFNIARATWIHKATHVHPLYPASCTSDVRTDAGTGEEVIVSRSVELDITRGMRLDGNEGRSSMPLTLAAPRRRAPGWDGCRDRADGQHGLTQQLQWVQPSQRSGHAAVYDTHHHALFMYGGESIWRAVEPLRNETQYQQSVSELWYLDLTHCVNNCSGHGTCMYGHCICTDGWYGLDCSNITCPGTLCYYDENDFHETCFHCLSLPHVHTLHEYLTDPEINQLERHRLVFAEELAAGAAFDANALPHDRYVTWARKARANLTTLPTSDARTRKLLDMFEGGVDMSEAAAIQVAARIRHGVCDGFGACACAPPFLGDDCSIRDCPNECNGHGWCAVEYPVSRCMCDPPWTGFNCSILMCPNNCTFPNGRCVDGHCECAWMANPYNRTQRFAQFAGDDCSFVLPFASASSARLTPLVGLLVAAAALVLLRVLPPAADEEEHVR